MSSASAPLWTTLSIGTILAAFLGWWGLKSVMIANNRQAWINALRDDLAQFFTSIDTIHFVMAKLSRSGESSDLEEQQKKSRLRKSAQDDKWSFCLTAGTLCPANQEKQ
jgi:hypothetical protein